MSPRFPQSQDKPDDSIEVDNNSDFVILDTPSVVDQLDQVFENILTRRTLDNQANQSSLSIETTGLNNSDLNTNLSSSSSSEMGFDIISSAYAAVVAAGGIMGYVKAGSVPSLIAGLVFGGTLGVGAYMTSKDPSNYYLTLGTSTLLTGLMGYRFYNSGKFMPAGLIACISFAMVLNISYRALSGSAQHVKK